MPFPLDDNSFLFFKQAIDDNNQNDINYKPLLTASAKILSGKPVVETITTTIIKNKIKDLLNENEYNKIAEDTNDIAPNSNEGVSHEVIKEITHEGEISLPTEVQTTNKFIDPIQLYNDLNTKLTLKWHDWEFETLERLVSFDKTQEDIVGALQVLVNTNQALEHWHIFEKIGHAFNNNIVDFTVVSPLEPAECAYTLYVINKLRNKPKYDNEIISYIAACCKHAGLVFLPEDIFVIFGDKKLQSELSALGNDDELAQEVSHAYKFLLTSTSPNVSVQLTYLKEIKNYLNTRIPNI